MLYLNLVEKDKVLILPSGVIDNTSCIITLEQMQTHGGRSIKLSVNAPYETAISAIFADPRKCYTKRKNADELTLRPLCVHCDSRTHKTDCIALTYRR